MRRRFPLLDLIWAEGVYNAWPVDAAVERNRRCAWISSPSAGKTRSVEYQITAPIASAVIKTGAAPLAQPSPYPEPTNQIKQRRQIPQTDTSVGANSPAVSSLEAFRTPASVQPLRPVTGRHPKTLNESGPSAALRRQSTNTRLIPVIKAASPVS